MLQLNKRELTHGGRAADYGVELDPAPQIVTDHSFTEAVSTAAPARKGTMKTISFLSLSLLTVACASSPKPSVATGPDTRGAEADRNATPSGENAVAIHIDENVRRACGLEDSKAWFGFDSADLKNKDLPVLNAVAKCFNAGPLQGKTLLLVGYADPRGEFEYNMVLGGRRAESVRSYVLGEGLETQRVKTSSRGEMDARGSDEPSWAADRRVDVRLAD